MITERKLAKAEMDVKHLKNVESRYVMKNWDYRVGLGLILTKQNDYFWGHFDHFWIKQYF